MSGTASYNPVLHQAEPPSPPKPSGDVAGPPHKQAQLEGSIVSGLPQDRVSTAPGSVATDFAGRPRQWPGSPNEGRVDRVGMSLTATPPMTSTQLSLGGTTPRSSASTGNPSPRSNPRSSGTLASRVATPAPLQIDNTQYVTIPLAAALTGYTAKAIRRKIETGVWIEGREIRRAPDGRILVNVKAYRQWVERGRA